MTTVHPAQSLAFYDPRQLIELQLETERAMHQAGKTFADPRNCVPRAIQLQVYLHPELVNLDKMESHFHLVSIHE